MLFINQGCFREEVGLWRNKVKDRKFTFMHPNVWCSHSVTAHRCVSTIHYKFRTVTKVNRKGGLRVCFRFSGIKWSFRPCLSPGKNSVFSFFFSLPSFLRFTVYFMCVRTLQLSSFTPEEGIRSLTDGCELAENWTHDLWKRSQCSTPAPNNLAFSKQNFSVSLKLFLNRKYVYKYVKKVWFTKALPENFRGHKPTFGS